MDVDKRKRKPSLDGKAFSKMRISVQIPARATHSLALDLPDKIDAEREQMLK
jgi:hypothetical protein